MSEDMVNPNIVSKYDEENIVKTVEELISQTLNLKEQKLKITLTKDSIYLNKLNAENRYVKCMRIVPHDKNYNDCELIINRGTKKPVVFKGSLQECLKSANAASYVI